MHRYLNYIFFFVYSLSFSQIISYQKINTFTLDELNLKWKDNSIPKLIAPVKYSVDIYDVIYFTEWYDGSLTKASGLYFVPNIDNSPLIVYNHGTRVSKNYRDLNCNRESLNNLCRLTIILSLLKS